MKTVTGTDLMLHTVRAPSLPHQFEYHTERNLGPKSLGIFIFFFKKTNWNHDNLDHKNPLKRLGELLTKQTNSFGRANPDYPELILGQRNHECKFFFLLYLPSDLFQNWILSEYKMCKKVRFRMVLVLVVVLKKKTDKSITLISHTDHTTNKLLVFHIIYNILYGFNKVEIEFYNLRP